MNGNCCVPPMQGGMSGGNGFGPTNSAVSYIDWGGRYSASPDYDAAGSPHGYYGPPAVAAMLQNAMRPAHAPPPPPPMLANMMQSQCPPGYMPMSQLMNKRSRAGPDLANDEYWLRREQEVRTGLLGGSAHVPQGTKAYFPSEPTTPGRYTYTKPASRSSRRRSSSPRR
ncbi:hypothetical protein DIPPA_32949 [Diplonema papillatum]|nr:hypothetical protein DIPPA_32949 [Diplonema papillatum]